MRLFLFSVQRTLFLRMVIGVVILLSTLSRGQEDAAALRLVHLSPDAPRVDLLVDGELLLADLSFGMFSDHLQLSPGEHEIQVFPHRLPRRTELTQSMDAPGQAADETDDAPAPRRLEAITTFITLEPGKSYTLALVGFYEPPPPEQELGALVINVLPDNSRVDVSGSDGYATSLVGSQTLDELRPGIYTLTISRTGYQTSQYDVEVQPGLNTTTAVTLQLEATETDTPPQVSAANPKNVWRKVELQLYPDSSGSGSEQGQAIMKVVHSSPLSQAINVVLHPNQSEQADALALTTNLAFPNDSGDTAVLPGAYDLSIVLAGTSQVLTTLAGLELEPSLAYTLYLVGPRGDNHVQVVPNVDALTR